MPKPKSKPAIRIRQATRADIPELVTLNRAAYPTLAKENIVWSEAHLLSHLRVFPQGQIVAIHKERSSVQPPL